MPLADALVTGLHLLFASLWTGSVWFLTVAVLPPVLAGDVAAAPMRTITERFQWITRASAVVLLLTGAHMALTSYGQSALLSTGRGHLVLTMAGLWLALAGLSEVAASKLAAGFDRDKVREPARNARPFVYAAAAVAVSLVADAAAITAL